MPNHHPPEDALLEEFIEQCKHVGVPASGKVLVATLQARHAAESGVWQRVAEGMIRAGFVHAAADLLDVAVERFPHESALRYWRGNALRLDGRHAEAERDFRAVLAAVPAPHHGDAAFSLAHMLREDGRLSAAAEVIDGSLRACAGDRDRVMAGLAFLRECGAHHRAHALAGVMRARWPESAGIAAMDGEFALATGDFVKAREALRAALARNPRDGMSWLRLSYCRRFATRDDPDVRRIESAWRDRALDADLRVCMGFALGKVLADVGARVDAVAVLRDVNAAAAARATWNLEAWRAFVKRQLDQRSLPQVTATADHVPVFMVGLPRTGTTLAASLLASDERLRNRGELNWIDAVYGLLAGRGQLHDRAALSSAAGLVGKQLRQDDPPSRWYLDKNPLNFRYLNLIAAIFPNAKIIHCRRGLRDTTLSLWMQHFAHPDLGFSYDFSNIAAFVEGQRRLMAHWRDTLPLEFFDLEYESLVSGPGEVLQRLRNFLGMPADAMTGDTRDQQTITTASVWQVRQPLHTGSIGRWIDYAGYLPELEQVSENQ